MNDTNHIEYISPEHRNHPDAQEFAEHLALLLDFSPEDFSSGYAWECEIPPRGTWDDEAERLNAHCHEQWDE